MSRPPISVRDKATPVFKIRAGLSNYNLGLIRLRLGSTLSSHATALTF